MKDKLSRQQLQVVSMMDSIIKQMDQITIKIGARARTAGTNLEAGSGKSSPTVVAAPIERSTGARPAARESRRARAR